jgi:hypothetical protein
VPGTYELTFVAGAACTALPPHARTRTYTAALSPASSTAVLSGARFAPAAAPYAYWNVLYTRLEGESADIWFQDPPLWESLPDDSYLVIFGDAHGSMAAGRSTLPFWGRFEYCSHREPDGYPECQVPVVTCESASHQLIVERK